MDVWLLGMELSGGRPTLVKEWIATKFCPDVHGHQRLHTDYH